MSTITYKTSNTKEQNAQRLIVLVPLGNLNEVIYGRQIWDLAHHSYRFVLYLTVAQNDDEFLFAQHRMVRLAAITHDRLIKVQTKIEIQTNWLHAIKRVCQPGDTLVCRSDHQLTYHIFWRRPIIDIIQASFDLPIIGLNVNINIPKNGNGHV